ncbi:DUF4381 family protein [Luteimonas sp. M1R5S18]|uniref:DUF4381 family protein n=1 Tax=Luteimonas rhizosphaericola TaxID=3042024 RepID=A0ABT6JN69_9GAMM|nr:DUF4381 family protein [Luteimonas rhizosphaericola]MDH5831972.1 DUF4381 family protein [Luteimonas rhizosphaericola]
MTPVDLPLRDVHEPHAPPWWPPAPGWWIVAAALLLALGAWLAWRGWQARRRRLAARVFDDTLAQARTPAQQVAAISLLLRRAAKRIDPAADTLSGDDWLRLLDRGLPGGGFIDGPGALLREGPYRADVDPSAAEALRTLARARFLDWTTRRR